uniref:(northern house mosquito) hypothetical protein n=1 Tax=Culex pipiens TaxID=7175 RepID=A0A8D8AV65_CULPI
MFPKTRLFLQQHTRLSPDSAILESILVMGITKVLVYASGNSPRDSDLITISSNSTATTFKASIMTRFVTFPTPAQFVSDRTVCFSLFIVIGSNLLNNSLWSVFPVIGGVNAVGGIFACISSPLCTKNAFGSLAVSASPRGSPNTISFFLSDESKNKSLQN